MSSRSTRWLTKRDSGFDQRQGLFPSALHLLRGYQELLAEISFSFLIKILLKNRGTFPQTRTLMCLVTLLTGMASQQLVSNLTASWVAILTLARELGEMDSVEILTDK